MELKQLQYIMCLPSQAPPRLQGPESSKPTIGICKFCGQAYNVSFAPLQEILKIKTMPDEEFDELITKLDEPAKETACKIRNKME